MPAPFLHVANGTRTTELIEAAGIPGLRSIWGDPLYEGPVPGGIDDEALLTVRAEYLSRASGIDVHTIAVDLREWRRTIQNTIDYDELVLWYEHDLFDQLNLIQLLVWIREHVAASTLVTLVCIDRFPGRPHFKGLGELTAADIASLLETRRPVDAAQSAISARAWDALRASTPALLETMAHSDVTAMPFLRPALARLLEEYPSVSGGLSRTERRLLSLAAEGPIDSWTAFRRMHDDEVYFVTDSSFVALMDAFTALPHPLLTTTDLVRRHAPIPRCSLSITDAGRAVLQGRTDAVELRGVDRWIGGVHLHGHAAMWRWDSTAGRLMSAASGWSST